MGPLKWGDPEYCPGRRPMKLALGTGPIFLSEIKNKTKQQFKKKTESCLSFCQITKNSFMEAVINANFIGVYGSK